MGDEQKYPLVPQGWGRAEHALSVGLYERVPYNHGVWTRSCCGFVIPHKDPDSRPEGGVCPVCKDFYIPLTYRSYKYVPYMKGNGDLAACMDEIPEAQQKSEEWRTYHCRIEYRRNRGILDLQGIDGCFHDQIRAQGQQLLKRSHHVSRLDGLNWSLESEFNWRAKMNSLAMLETQMNSFSGDLCSVSSFTIEDIVRLQQDGKFEAFQAMAFAASVNNIIGIKGAIMQIVDQMNNAGNGLVNAGHSLSVNF